jgi:heat shock protein 1/8
VIAKGSALQALSLTQTYPLDSPSSLAVFASSLTESAVVNPSTTSAPIGLVLEDKSFVTLVEEFTPLPLRRIFELPVPAGTGSAQILLSLSEGINEVKVEVPEKKAKSGGGFFSRASKDEEEDEEDEEEEVRTKVLRATKALTDLVVDVDANKGKAKSAPKLRVTVVVEVGGKGTISAVQLVDGAKVASASF